MDMFLVQGIVGS